MASKRATWPHFAFQTADTRFDALLQQAPLMPHLVCAHRLLCSVAGSRRLDLHGVPRPRDQAAHFRTVVLPQHSRRHEEAWRRANVDVIAIEEALLSAIQTHRPRGTVPIYGRSRRT